MYNQLVIDWINLPSKSQILWLGSKRKNFICNDCRKPKANKFLEIYFTKNNKIKTHYMHCDKVCPYCNKKRSKRNGCEEISFPMKYNKKNIDKLIFDIKFVCFGL